MTAVRMAYMISLVWYCRRKRPFDDDEKPRSFTNAPGNALDEHPASRSASEDIVQSPTQMQSIDHPSAWTGAYAPSHPGPQMLDSHSIRPLRLDTGYLPQDPTDGVSRLSRTTYDSLKTPLSPSDSSYGSFLIKEQPGEEVIQVPPPLVVRRQSTYELPG